MRRLSVQAQVLPRPLLVPVGSQLDIYPPQGFYLLLKQVQLCGGEKSLQGNRILELSTGVHLGVGRVKLIKLSPAVFWPPALAQA